jgi:hypothetical protein
MINPNSWQADSYTHKFFNSVQHSMTFGEDSTYAENRAAQFTLGVVRVIVMIAVGIFPILTDLFYHSALTLYQGGIIVSHAAYDYIRLSICGCKIIEVSPEMDRAEKALEKKLENHWSALKFATLSGCTLPLIVLVIEYEEKNH